MRPRGPFEKVVREGCASRSGFIILLLRLLRPLPGAAR